MATLRTSRNNIVSLTTTELNNIISNININSNSYVIGQFNIIYCLLNDSNLLMIDGLYSFNKLLFDTFSFSYSATNPFNISLTRHSDSTLFNINEGLTAVGYYSNSLPLTTLNTIFMTKYSITSSSTYVDDSNDLV